MSNFSYNYPQSIDTSYGSELIYDSDSMFSFVKEAIKSSENYFNICKKMKKSRIEYRPYSIHLTPNGLFDIHLQARVKHADTLAVSINHYLIKDEWYADKENFYIKPDLFQIVKSSNNGEIITAAVKGELKDALTQIDLGVISFVSDLTFLIKNVNKWYVKHGNLIREPHLSAFGESIKEGAPHFNQPDAYQEQQNATLMALSEPVSYVWGPPGTGKTQYVLADCIINHIQEDQKVIVCAPTNNALEQTLRAVISALEKLGKPIDCLYRCGTSSESFASEYGKICEHLSTQQKIDELKNEIEQLRELHQAALRAELVLKEHEYFTNFYSEYTSTKGNLENITFHSQSIKDQIATYKAQQSNAENACRTAQIKLNVLLKREKSLSFKIKKFFTIKEATQIEIDKDALSQQIEEGTKAAAQCVREIDILKSALSENLKKSNFQKSKFSELINNMQLCAKRIFGEILNVEDAFDRFQQAVDESSKVSRDPYIIAEIKDKEDLLNALLVTNSESLKDKKVFALTLDYFYLRYDRLIDQGIRLEEFSHVFLDEAAYCPLIKAGILFSLGVPVTFFGDHMQLPPICEASDAYIKDARTSIFFWSLPAIYFPYVFLPNASIQLLFHLYEKLGVPDKALLPRTDLLKTHRFGNNLAEILNKFVYKNNFSGLLNCNTDILVVHAPRSSNGELRENASEAFAIKSYIEKNNLTSFAVLTPYKAQRKLLHATLRHSVPSDNILTIHGSQGREWDTVILSIVDTHKKFFVDSSHSLGLHILNTAISRAKKQLVIVCDSNYWSPLADTQIVGALAAKRHVPD